MAIDVKAGQTIRITISKTIGRHAAKKTIERLFIKDKALVAPLNARSRNFKAIPKRRGGRIWTKRPNKIHLALDKGLTATVKATPQAIKDLASVEEFVQVAAQ
jgi:hypothetical protein